MTVYDNLAFGLKLARTPKAEVEQRVRHAAGLLEMEHLLDRYPKHLSGGQAQRVAVGRAIVKKPEVFLFDEPLSNLDAKLRAAMRVRLTELHRTLRESGQPATVVYVTHDQVEAMTMGERICVLKEGVIQQVDTPTALYDRPANAFVASFIGSPEMNIVSAQLKQGDEGDMVELGGQMLRLPATRAEQLNSGSGAVQFGLRPEHVSVGPRPQGDSIPVQGTLRFTEHMGSEVFVHFKVGENAMSARVPADELHGVQEKARGAAHVFHFQMQRAHLFDAQSGVSLLR
jgi:oligogalacturonide transport system ATP-binding protein